MDTPPPEDTVRLPLSQPIAPNAHKPQPSQHQAQEEQRDPATQVLVAAAPLTQETNTAPRQPTVTTTSPKSALTAKQRLLALLGALLIILVVIVSAGIIIAQPSGHTKLATTPGATSQVPHATASASPSAPHSVPLGSPLQSFSTTFGQPASTYPDSATYMATVQQLQTRIFVALAPGKDGAPHGQDIHVEPSNGVWNLDTAAAIMLQFLPADAQHQGDVAGPNGVSYHVYRSNTLAQIFPATTFTTLTRQAATAGDFSWFCASDLSFCYIGPLVPNTGS